MEVPKKKNKTKNRTTISSYSNSTSGNKIKESETLTQKDICTPMFIAALFTMARIWKQPK